MTLSRLAADAILILHTSFIAFVVLGLLIIWLGYFLGWSWTRHLGFRLAHLAAISFVVIQSFLGITCPLTNLEDRLRIAAGQDPYGDAGFIAHYLHRVIFFTAPTWVFTLCYTAFALLVIGTLILAPPRRRPRSAAIATSDPTPAAAG